MRNIIYILDNELSALCIVLNSYPNKGRYPMFLSYIAYTQGGEMRGDIFQKSFLLHREN